MMRRNKEKKQKIDQYYQKVKIQFFMQSFEPLFFLLMIRYFDCSNFRLIPKFIAHLSNGDRLVIGDAIGRMEFWELVICVFSAIWVVGTIIYMWAFRSSQTSGFTSTGEKIDKINYHDDVGLNFFASYLLPLIIDVDCFQKLLMFAGMLLLIFIMVWQSNLYYENPVLTIWGYRTFSFELKSGIKGIGITKSKIKLDGKIKRKPIIDDLYFVYNEA